MSRKKEILGKLSKVSWPVVTGNTRAKFFFLLLSVFLWFLIKLSKAGYTTEVSFPVEYSNLPADMRLESQPPEELRLTLRGQGFDLLRSRLRSLQPLEISVQSLDKIDSTRYRWNTDDNLENVASKVGTNIDVLNIFPNEVEFEFTPLRSKKVKVYLKDKQEFESFKTIYRSPTIRPDSVTVTGRREVLDVIDSVFTEEVVLRAKSDSVQYKLKLQEPQQGNVSLSHKEARVSIRYTSLTEDIIEVPVQVINLPEDYKLTVFPGKVKLRYQVPIDDYERVDTADFGAYVDYRDLEGENPQFLRVKLKSVPGYLHKLSLEPPRVEYILSEK